MIGSQHIPPLLGFTAMGRSREAHWARVVNLRPPGRLRAQPLVIIDQDLRLDVGLVSWTLEGERADRSSSAAISTLLMMSEVPWHVTT